MKLSDGKKVSEDQQNLFAIFFGKFTEGGFLIFFYKKRNVLQKRNRVCQKTFKDFEKTSSLRKGNIQQFIQISEKKLACKRTGYVRCQSVVIAFISIIQNKACITLATHRKVKSSSSECQSSEKIFH